MSDVNTALRASAHIGSNAEGNLQTLEVKENLLHILLENEQMRLVVWLYPLDHERRHIFTSPSGKISQEVGYYLQAWWIPWLTSIATRIYHWYSLGGAS